MPETYYKSDFTISKLLTLNLLTYLRVLRTAIIYIFANFMRYILRPIQIIYSIYAMLVFTLLMFILVPFVFLAGFFSSAIQSYITYFVVTFWSDVAMLLWGMWHGSFNKEQQSSAHPVVYVFNHISYLDIPVLLKSLRHRRIRILAKAGMAKIPVFGLVYKSASILVDRSSAAARAESVNKLKAALKKNISIVIAPEGTFNETGKPLKDFYDGAFRIAIETNTPVKPIIFLDTNERLNNKSVFSFTPGKTRTIFLEEVAVDNFLPADVETLKQKVYQLMEKALIENKASWITNKHDTGN